MQTLPAEHLESDLGSSLLLHVSVHGEHLPWSPFWIRPHAPEGRAVRHLPPSSAATTLAQVPRTGKPSTQRRYSEQSTHGMQKSD